MSEVVDKARFYVVDGDQKIELMWVESHSADDDGSVTTVKGPGGNIGTTREEGAWSLELQVRRPRGKAADINWDDAKDNDKVFRFEVQEIGGGSFQYFGCRVSNIKDSHGSGERTRTIQITSPRRKARSF